MDLSRVEKIANAVLYEGYILYPYRPSAIKNQQRWNFGVLSPESLSKSQGGSDAWRMQTQCLVQVADEGNLDLKVRFLQLVSRAVGEFVPSTERSGAEFDYQLVDQLKVDEKIFRPWQEAVEREVDVTGLKLHRLGEEKVQRSFSFPSTTANEVIRNFNNDCTGVLIRTQEEVRGVIEVSSEKRQGVFLLTVSIINTTGASVENCQNRDQALMRSLVSVHTILSVSKGKFVSLIDPPDELISAAAACVNVGTWPVMVGEEGQENMMLSSPIILYDYPQVAAESPGDLCDGTETDELLTLCIMALSDEEKREMRNGDEHARAILARTEILPAEQLAKMHGAIRGLRRVETKKA
ncbi:MAG TPA: hypothetical protein VIV66_18930 [Pyrinomonadaceae bacterium]